MLICFVSVMIIGTTQAQDQYIFPYGSGPSKAFIEEIITLTGKERPKICYLPTASGDSEQGIIRWYDLVHDLSVEPYVQNVWISSYSQDYSFEDMLLKMDAIVVGGGNGERDQLEGVPLV